MIATALIILLAGYDTTAMVMSYALYQLAVRPDVQDRLLGELDRVLGGKEPGYDDLQGMEYLEMVCMENADQGLGRAR